MKVKVSEASGSVLDWLVAMCEGIQDSAFVRSHMDAWPYSTDWAQGGPIIERRAIEVTRYIIPATLAEEWRAHCKGIKAFYGPTPLVAAMRCRVASKLGDVVEVPDELS